MRFSMSGYLSLFLVLMFLFSGTMTVLPEKDSKIGSETPIQEVLVNEVYSKSPKYAMKALKESNSSIEDSCHPLVHSIGSATYRKYKDFNKSISYFDSYCNSGFMHGVLQEYFEHQEELPNASALCSRYQKTYLGWQCRHGLGHGFMSFTEGDLNRSIELCEMELGSVLGTKACVNGAYMEIFMTHNSQGMDSKYLHPKDIFRTCERTKKRYKSQCYIYVNAYYLHKNPGDFSEGIQKCLNVENNSLGKACVAGFSSKHLKHNINDPSAALSLCSNISDNVSDTCMTAMASYLPMHTGNFSEGSKFCRRVVPSSQTKKCLNGLSSLKPLFRD